jgi:hypothetical protein
MMARGLVLEADTIVRFTKSGSSIYTVYGFEKCPPVDMELEAIPQGYLIELSLPVFRRVDGIWIVLEDHLADIVATCQNYCERGETQTFADLLVEFDRKSIEGLYSIGVLGDRFRPERGPKVASRSRFVYGGLMLHELYAGEAIRHLKTYWFNSRYRVIRKQAASKNVMGKDSGTVGALVQRMDDKELEKFARQVVDGSIELFFEEKT